MGDKINTKNLKDLYNQQQTHTYHVAWDLGILNTCVWSLVNRTTREKENVAKRNTQYPETARICTEYELRV